MEGGGSRLAPNRTAAGFVRTGKAQVLPSGVGENPDADSARACLERARMPTCTGREGRVGVNVYTLRLKHFRAGAPERPGTRNLFPRERERAGLGSGRPFPGRFQTTLPPREFPLILQRAVPPSCRDPPPQESPLLAMTRWTAAE